MRTNIEIDDKLMKQALKLSGLKTKKDVVDASLQMFIQMQAQRNIRGYFGAFKSWEGDIDAMRRDK